MTRVVNIRVEDCDVFIGRPGRFGNQFKIGRDGDRNDVVNKYREWFRAAIRDPEFREELEALRGRRLGCFCSPQRCHGDVIARYLNGGFE